MSWDDENAEFEVVINQEEQYSIWPSYKQIPAGWQAVGKKGLKADVLAYIEEHWTDMRPASLRKAMEAAAETNAASSA
ncbi:MbtH family protein [Paraburkholderia bannensis]|uniref:MbtH family protein n=1 Tax=Paraburkholderia bannensis TaxID=765414 RepID=UPI0004867060|nr:MbtH family NRPS accessory protein [Paraburkholderia bannensis]